MLGAYLRVSTQVDSSRACKCETRVEVTDSDIGYDNAELFTAVKSNWQKVQLNTDLLKRRTQVFIHNEKV